MLQQVSYTDLPELRQISQAAALIGIHLCKLRCSEDKPIWNLSCDLLFISVSKVPTGYYIHYFSFKNVRVHICMHMYYDKSTS